MRGLGLLLFCGACTAAASSPAPSPAPPSAVEPDVEEEPAAEAIPVDGGVDAPVDAPVDAGDAGAPLAAWARYVIAPGDHAATLEKGAAGTPKGGFVSGLAARDYELAFDPSAMYAIAQPAQPDDQLDWNKLPGLSDCGSIDLATDGVMFGWRWRLDTSPKVLEITAYANNARKHLTPAAPMVSLDAADLASVTPLRYRLWMDGALYRLSISGTVRGRAIDATATLPRRCAGTPPATLALQWAAGLYFGGTSTAPSRITARVFE